MVLMLDGLDASGVARDAGPGVFGIADFPDAVHALSIARDGEFSLSAVECGFVILGRIRTGEPRLTDFLATLALRVDDSGGVVVDPKDCATGR